MGEVSELAILWNQRECPEQRTCLQSIKSGPVPCQMSCDTNEEYHLSFFLVRNASRGHASEGHALPSAEIWSQAELPLGESVSQAAYHSPSHTKIRPLLPSARRNFEISVWAPLRTPRRQFYSVLQPLAWITLQQSCSDPCVAQLSSSLWLPKSLSICSDSPATVDPWCGCRGIDRPFMSVLEQPGLCHILKGLSFGICKPCGVRQFCGGSAGAPDMLGR